MKKFFAFLGIVILLGIIFILVAGMFMPTGYHFEKNITINAPKEEVWKNISLFSNYERWDPWKVHDPVMRRTIEGTDGTPGATYSWSGNDDVGSGSQTFTKLVPYEYITLELNFKEPFEKKANAFYRLEPIGQRVKVTWGFDTKFPYPTNAVMGLFVDMDEKMGADFSAGLANLKKLCESNSLMTASLYR